MVKCSGVPVLYESTRDVMRSMSIKQKQDVLEWVILNWDLG